MVTYTEKELEAIALRAETSQEGTSMALKPKQYDWVLFGGNKHG